MNNKKHNELFKYFSKNDRWNKMCIESDMSHQQVFGDNTKDEEKEQEKTEPTAHVGQAQDFDIMTQCM